MRAHAARGERGMAIQAYDRCRAVLADLLDAAPSQETQRLLAEIRGRRTAAACRSAPRRIHPPLQTAAPPPTLLEDDLADDEPVPVLEPRADNQASRGGAHVGVLPMQFPGGTDEEAHLAPGLAEEITTALSRFRWMFVVASSSLARFAPRHATRLRSAARSASTSCSTARSSASRNRLRITLRLLDLRAGNQVVWARRFDRQTNDLLTLQDEIAAEVVAQIDPEILLIEARRSRRAATGRRHGLRPGAARDSADWPAGAAHNSCRPANISPGRSSWSRITPPPMPGMPIGTRSWWARAGRRTRARSWSAPANSRNGRSCWIRSTRRALTIAGHVRAFLHRRLREAIALHERALSLNPNLAMAWALSACAYAYLGDPDEAERRNNRYKKLSPLDPHAFFYDTFFIYIHLLKRDYESAVVAGRAVSEMNPSFSASHRLYLAALGHLGRLQEAAVVRGRLLTMEPDFTIERFLRDNAAGARDRSRADRARAAAGRNFGTRCRCHDTGRRGRTDQSHASGNH